jgi:hypothetical protein
MVLHVRYKGNVGTFADYLRPIVIDMKVWIEIQMKMHGCLTAFN